MTDLIWVFLVLVPAGAAVGWWHGKRYRPAHKRDPITPRHVAVSVPRLGSMCLDAEMTVRGSDDCYSQPLELPDWLGAPVAFDPGHEDRLRSALRAAAESVEPGSDGLGRILHRVTSGELLSGKLLAEVTSELDRQDQDKTAYLSFLAAWTALARLDIMKGWQ